MAIKIQGTEVIKDDLTWNSDLNPSSHGTKDLGKSGDISRMWKDLFLTGSVHAASFKSNNQIGFFTYGNGAQNINVNSIYAGQSYANADHSTGVIDAYNGVKINGKNTTIILQAAATQMIQIEACTLFV